MKKLMLAVLVGLMVIASASIAAAEITVGGNIEVRYDVWNNLGPNRSLNKNTTRTLIPVHTVYPEVVPRTRRVFPPPLWKPGRRH